MKQIAQLMHVDESRVSQIHSGALVRLKASANSLLRPTNTKISESGTRSMAAGAGLPPNPRFRNERHGNYACAMVGRREGPIVGIP